MRTIIIASVYALALSACMVPVVDTEEQVSEVSEELLGDGACFGNALPCWMYEGKSVVSGKCIGGSCCTGCVNARGQCMGGESKYFCGGGGNACGGCDDDNACTSDACVGKACVHAAYSEPISCSETNPGMVCIAGLCSEI